jgi:DNA-binding NarL/FixJ family response regulator
MPAKGVEEGEVTEEARCLIVDDQPLVRLGVRRLLDDRFEVIDEAEDGEGALQMVTDVENFDVAIVDTGRPTAGNRGMSGTRMIRALLDARPGLGIVAHGDRPERYVAVEALRAGARAYVSKSSPASELSRAVDAASAETETFVDPAASPGAGKVTPVLTRRQREILQLLADGHSTESAANSLGLSPETVRTHIKAVLARLGARDRAHAVAIAFRGGLID